MGSDSLEIQKSDGKGNHRELSQFVKYILENK
jgi:hypothetical protein